MSEIGSAAFGSAVSGGFGIIGSLINYGLQKRLAAQQNQYNIDMWKMQADYNSPQAQMQRFKDAGLNPNLIYGQGSNGNMSTPLQMVTPQAPELTHEMRELGKAFNIENLRTLVANRKEAQEKARLAELSRFDKEDERDALARLGEIYTFNQDTGRYEYLPGSQIDVTAPNPRGHRIGDRTTTGGHMLAVLSKNYGNTYLLPYRSDLLGKQSSYLQPQIQMLNYERKYQPYSFWIGQGTKILNSLPLPKFSFSRKLGESPSYRNY